MSAQKIVADKQKLKNAIKQKDGWWATIFSSKIANLFLYFIADSKSITPNCVTSSSLFLCFVSGFFIATGTSTNLIIGAILIQLVFVLDCLDGQLARYRNAGTNFGAWFDRVTDRVKDFIIYFSICWGHFHIYNDWRIWPLGMMSLFFVYLFDYYVNQDIKLEPRTQTSELRRKTFLSFVFSFGETIYKSIPILQFHIGEQYLLISIFLFLNQTRLLFYLIILLGCFYALYWPVARISGRKPD